MSTPKHRKKKRKLRVGRLIALIAILAVLIAALVFVSRYSNASKAYQRDSEEVSFTVDSGTSTRQVLENLQSEGIIKDADMAYLYVRLHDFPSVLAGTYTLNKNWTLREIFDYMSNSSNAEEDHATVTIIEGDNVEDIARKVSQVTNVSGDDLLALWNNQDWIRSQMDSYPFLTDDIFNDQIRTCLEGYLAPETYYLYPQTTPEKITKTFLNGTMAVYQQLADQFAGKNIHDIYTLASIVQNEAGNYDDMRKIAQVFYNRMNDQPDGGGTAGLLQSSVTVCYAANINLNQEDWRNCESSANAAVDDPYNTYMYAGLPPGPICAPGIDALRAVLDPDTSMEGYYYFMADVSTGTIYYAKTLAEQNANIAAAGNNGIAN